MRWLLAYKHDLQNIWIRLGANLVEDPQGVTSIGESVVILGRFQSFAESG